MKIQRNNIKRNDNFGPFNLVLTIESKEEAQALYAIFSYVPNIALMVNATADIRALLEKYRITNGVIANNITVGPFYKSKQS